MKYKTEQNLLIHSGAGEHYSVVGYLPAGTVIDGRKTVGAKYNWLEYGPCLYVKVGVPQFAEYTSKYPDNFSVISLNSVISIGDGFDAPVGTKRERSSSVLWPGGWVDTNPFGSFYMPGSTLAYHTGADLSFHDSPDDSYRGRPIHAIGNGRVVFAKKHKSWGKIIVIVHDPVPCSNTHGIIVSSRYAHLWSISVKEGDRLKRGDKIGIVSSSDPRGPFHFHFDISYSNIILNSPTHWPGGDWKGVFDNYLDPLEFIQNNRPK